MKKRRSVWLIPVTLLVVGGFLFRAPLLKEGTRMVLSHLLDLQDRQLSFGDCFLQQGKVVITDLKVNAGYELKIERAEISFSHPLTGFSLHPFLLIVSPELTIDPFAISSMQKKRFIQEIFFSRLEIERGELHIKGIQQPYYFSFEAGKEKGKIGTFTLAAESDLMHAPFLVAELSSIEKVIQAGFAIKAIRIEELYDLFSLLYPPLLPHLQDMEGEMEGTGQFFFDQGHLEHFECSLDAKQIAFPSLLKNVSFEAESFHGEFRYPGKDKQNESLPFWKSSAVFGRLQGGSLLISSPEWGLTEMEVDLCFDPEMEPEIDLKGVLLKEGLAHPLHISGRGEMHPDRTFWIDLGLKSGDPDTMDHFLSICSAEDGKYLIQAEFEKVDREDVRLLQDFFSPWVPPLKQITVSNGVFRGKILGWIGQGSVRRFEIQNLEGAGLELSSSFFPVKEIKGEAAISLCLCLKNQGWQLNTLDLRMENSFLRLDAAEKKLLNFDDLSLQFNLGENGAVSSSLQGLVEGVGCDMAFKGTMDALKGTCDLKISKDLFGFEQESTGFLELDWQPGRWNIDGKLEWPDHQIIAFHLNHLKEGWFESTPLDSAVYHPFLNWIDPALKVSGQLSLNGHFDGEYLEVEPEGEELGFKNTWIEGGSFKLNRGTVFSYNVKEHSLRCVVPFKETTLLEKKYGLNFNHLDGLLIYENGSLVLQDLKGSCEGIDFIGALHLNTSSPSGPLLSFNAQDLKGSIEDAVRIMDRLNVKLELLEGLKGTIRSGKNGFKVLISPHDSSQPFDVRLVLDVFQAGYPSCNLEDLSFHVTWESASGLLSVTNLFGNLASGARSWQLFLPYFYFHPQQEYFMEGSLRIEDKEEEVLSLAVKAKKRDCISLVFDRQATQLFNAKLNIAQCDLTPNMEVAVCDLYPQFTLSSLIKGCAFFSELELIQPIDSWIIDHVHPWIPATPLTAHLFFDRSKEKLLLDAESQDASLSLSLRKECGEWHLEKFKNGTFKASGFLQEGERKVIFSNAMAAWKGGELFIEEGIFSRIYGNMSDLKSFLGTGSLKFVAHMEPAGFHSPQGLDASLFIPSKGELFCQLKEGKLVFTDLENTCSENRKSQFFLSSDTQNYLDFNGNLFVDLGMKQQVIEAMEPFKIRVRGTLPHPAYDIVE